MDIKEYANQLLKNGYDYQASDLYLFPTSKGFELSFRYHQGKKHYATISTELGNKLILFFKYLADMDVAEKRRIQVGAGSVRINGKRRRIRLSTVGDFRNRESLVIRFLHDLTNSDSYRYFFPQQLKKIEYHTKQRGLFLFSGPTGSGKTTTMYRLAKNLAANNQQVITIEDPVELQESAFLQLQVNTKIAISYEDLVKVCLRHRPDVLIVGEIRDSETAQAVVRGALTGHTIYSTIHGLNKESIVPRLLELGVSQGDLNQCLGGIIYQRLLPVNCSFCDGTCSLHCPKKGGGVVFDSKFFKEKSSEEEREGEAWQKILNKAWACNFITKKVWLEER